MSGIALGAPGDLVVEDVAVEELHPDSQRTLADLLAKLRRRTGFVVTDRVLLVVGSFLLPLAVVLEFLGWYGAAHTTRLFEQVPYLISGGLLGIVLAVIGGFCYFGYWLTRYLANQRELLDSLLRIEDRLERVEATTPVVTREGGPSAQQGALTMNGYVATKSGSMYHRPDCPAVAGRAPRDLRSVDPATNDLRPCRICVPLTT